MVQIRLFLVFLLISIGINTPIAANSSSSSSSSSSDQGSVSSLHPDLDLNLFLGIQQVSEEFLRTFPPSEYIYVGLGRSPHWLLGYLEAIQGVNPIYIPMSSARYFFGYNDGPEYVSIETEERHKILDGHFDRFIPAFEELGNKKVLMVDFIYSSFGLKFGYFKYAEAFYRNGLNPSIIEMVALDHGKTPGKPEIIKTDFSDFKWSKQSDVIQTQMHHFNSRIFSGEDFFAPVIWGNERIQIAMIYGDESGWLESVSPVSSFDLQTLEKGETYSERRPEYDLFLEWMKSSYKNTIHMTGCERSFF